MLASVEYDEDSTIRDSHGDLVDRILLQTEIEAQSSSSGCRHLRPVLDQGKVHKGNRIEGRAQAICHSNGHGCLADAAWADQRQQAAPGRFRCQRDDDFVAANNSGDLSGKTLRLQSLEAGGLRRILCCRSLNVEDKAIAATWDGSDVAVPATTQSLANR